MTDRNALTRERVASAAQYILLGGFASVAAGISAQGLTGFARSNMALHGPWPYLLFFALDGAAGVCAVLLARRSARADGGLAPRLAVWGLVTASAFFNFTHAPRRPAAPQAYALMPVVAAVLFEFCLREMKIRRTGRADRKLSGLRWLYPAERVRVQRHLTAHEQASAGEATRHVRIEQAARRLYQLRLALHAQDRQGRPGSLAAIRARRAQRRAHAALIRAGFTVPDVAAEVLRQVQVLMMTTTLARLDYNSPEAAQAAIANLITPPAAPRPRPGSISVPPVTPGHAAARAGAADRMPAAPVNGHAAGNAVARLAPPHPAPANGAHAATAATAGEKGQAAGPHENSDDGDGDDARLIEAAARIVADAAQDGSRLSQVTLAEKLRSQGYSISNQRLRWLSAASGLEPRQGRPARQRAPGRTRQHKDEPAQAHGAAGPAATRPPTAARGAAHDHQRTGGRGAAGQDLHPRGDP